MHTAYAIASESYGGINPSPDATKYIASVVDELRRRLDSRTARFSLMPYRVHGAQFLGFDWIDAEGNALSLTYEATGEFTPRGEPILDAGTVDLVDALLIARSIAIEFKGTNQGAI
jgi:hypothetical protein